MKQMNKKLAVLAVTLAIPMTAKADVTIYGLMSASLESAKASSNGAASNAAARTNRIEDENSRIGFKGDEDLGNGLKAIWQVESGLRNFEQGGTNDKAQTATFATRNSFVGLQSASWGVVHVGYYDSAYKRLTTSDLGINLWHDTEGDINPSSVQGVVNRRNARLQNSISYTSPVWQGVQFGVSYGLDESRPLATNGTRQNDSRFDAAVEYTNGGLKLGAGYDHEGDKLNTAATADSQKSVTGLKLAGSYKFERTGSLIGASYERVHTINNGTPNTTQADWMVAFSQPVVGALTFNAVYGRLGKLEGAPSGTSPDQYQASQLTMGFTYDLSKRTQLYVFESRIHNHGQQNADFNNNPVYSSGLGTTSAALAKGDNPQVIALGMSIAF